MKHKSGPLAPRTRPVLVAATLLVALGLAFLPYGPSPVVALTSADPTATDAPTADPGQSAAPDQTPTATDAPTADPGQSAAPDPSSTAIDPTAGPSPEPSPPPADPTPAPSDTSTPAPTDGPTATESATPGPSDSAAPAPSDSAAPLSSESPSPSPSPTPSPAPGTVVLSQGSTAPAEGRHRIDPGSAMTITISLRAETETIAGDLMEIVPPDWTILTDDGGTFDAASGTITWSLDSIAASDAATRTISVVAPNVPTVAGDYVLPATFSASFAQGDDVQTAPGLAVTVAPRVVIPHFTPAQVDGVPPSAIYLGEDSPIVGQQRFRVFRIRFEVRNPDTLDLTWTPRLESRPLGSDPFAPVPAGDAVEGVPFYVAPEWVPNPGPAGGTMPGPAEEAIAASTLVVDERATGDQATVTGLHSMGLNPIPSFDLPALSMSVLEFSVRATVDAAYLGGYEFRLTDGSVAFPGAIQPQVWLGPQPDLALTPGQRAGAMPEDAIAAGLAFGPAVPKYALVAPTSPAAATPSDDAIHGPYTLTTDACGACHRAHTAEGPSLTTQPPPQYGLCVSCHDGSGGPSAANVKDRYAAVPTNDPTTRSYYQHDPTQVAGHTSAETDVLAGTVNRHAECSDCHSPHRASASPDASPDPAGWTSSGRLAGATGVAVTNAAAGSAPSYSPVPAIATEYQLCLKCHSGYTALLPDPTPAEGSPVPYTQFELDKGIEFNPNNLSYHPVEAPGRNSTSQMDASLAGTSPYKLWTLSSGSTIRCVNCHADAAKIPAASPSPTPELGQGSSLPVHASPNRGILIQNYRDRTLKGWVEPYSANDFALCYTCHAEAPFVDTSGAVRSDTNFRYHGVHVSGGDLLGHGSTGTSIDTPGDGGGLATCSECHFRIHSTTFAVPGQAIDGQRLVNFAPDVTAEQPLIGTLAWTARTPTQAGTCTLTCHSQPHRARTY